MQYIAHEANGFRLYIFHNILTLSFLHQHLPTALTLASEKKFRSTKRQREWLSVRYFLRTHIGVNASIAYTSTGQPYLIDDPHHISISHCKDYIAIALCSKHAIGIDVENISHRALRSAAHYLNAEEYAWTTASKPNISLQRCTLLWCAKESLYKVANLPGLSLVHDLHISPPRMDNPTFRGRVKKTDRWHTLTLHYLYLPHAVLVYTWSQ